MIVVHEVTSRHLGTLFVRTEVDMYLRAGTAGTCIAHFPEVVVLVAVDYVVGRQMLLPDSGGFIVAGQSLGGRALEHRGIQALRIEL